MTEKKKTMSMEDIAYNDTPLFFLPNIHVDYIYFEFHWQRKQAKTQNIFIKHPTQTCSETISTLQKGGGELQFFINYVPITT